MSVYNASPYFEASRQPSVNAFGGGGGGGGGAQSHQSNRHKNANAQEQVNGARKLCDAIIILALLAAIAFIIAGLTTNSWIFYTATNYTVATRGLFQYCSYNQSGLTNASVCSQLDLGTTSTVTDVMYWNIVSLRRTAIAAMIIAVALAGIAVLVHVFCCVPGCRRRSRHGFWKNAVISGILSAFAAAMQIVGMIVFQAALYYEAAYAGVNCVDCFSTWPKAQKTTLTIACGVSYALGWAAAGLLTYVGYAYLSREVCVVSRCRPEAQSNDDLQNLDAMSGISTPYLKGSARDLQYGQAFGTPRLQRYDVGTARLQPLPPTMPPYVSAFARSDLVY